MSFDSFSLDTGCLFSPILIPDPSEEFYLFIYFIFLSHLTFTTDLYLKKPLITLLLTAC